MRRRPALELGARLRCVPATAWACGVVACVNAVCWSVITPPLQVPDEPDHVAYVQELAETGRLPTASAQAEFSTEEIYALNDLHQGLVQFKPQVPATASVADQRKLQGDLALSLPRRERVNAGTAAGEPPLYYALETIPYRVGSAGTLLVRIQLMRLLSSLMAGLTALFTFLFVRETLPGARWAWIVGALCVALMPLLGFVSGGVNPESMLVAVSAALFYFLARAFRRGLTPRLAVVIGFVAAIGFLTKLNFIGLAPGMFLGLLLLTVRASQTSRRSALTSLALALSIACMPVFLYILINVLSGAPGLGQVSQALQVERGSVLHEIEYIWQFYLPKLPGMKSYFPGIFTTRQLWFNGLIGLYGWLDTVFPGWVYDLALVPAALIAMLCVRALVGNRVHLRRHLTELVVYAMMTIGLMILVGADSYISDTSAGGGPYWEPRYFLPLVPLLAVVLALAARGAGRRWGRAAGVLIVVMFFAHDVFSQLLVVARYYS
jgi:4-amino-4-deoxy-L-arabinose transferase-like glycosyltransferase